MNTYQPSFSELYGLARRAGLNPVLATFMATVWAVRGDRLTKED